MTKMKKEIKIFGVVKPISIAGEPNETLKVSIPDAWGGADEPLYTWRQVYEVSLWKAGENKITGVFKYTKVCGEIYDQFENKIILEDVGKIEDEFIKSFEVYGFFSNFNCKWFKGLLLSHVESVPLIPLFGYDGLFIELFELLLRRGNFEIKITPANTIEHEFAGQKIKKKVRAIIDFYPHPLRELKYVITHQSAEEWLEEMQSQLTSLKEQVRAEYLTALNLFYSSWWMRNEI